MPCWPKENAGTQNSLDNKDSRYTLTPVIPA
jgi:hypothetical protein